MSEVEHIFRCVIISPAGKLLDCQTASVIFTAHDGSRGVLYNHMPMLCELGLGIVEVKFPVARQEKNYNGNNHKKLALIDGGFALISSNLVNIIASDAVCGWDIKMEKIEHLLEKTQKSLNRLPSATPQYLHEARKNALLKKILERLEAQ
jgi:F0F1-type ATP synthase epsilon subunit